MTDHVVQRRNETRGAKRPSSSSSVQSSTTKPTARRTPVHTDAANTADALRVGPIDDAYEREADDVADRVVRSLTTSSPRVQRSAVDHSPTVPAVGRRIQRAVYPHGDGIVERDTFEKDEEFARAIEDLLDETFIGIRALFTAGGVATSIDAWGKLLYGLLDEDYDMGDYTPSDCAEVVENLKAEHRKEQFLQIAEFYGYFGEEYQPPIWSLEALTAELRKHHVVVDDTGKDDSALQALLDARGDRAILDEEPQRSFQFGADSQSLDIAGLKRTLDERLGTTVNWGHEITDCMDDSGKRGEMYYYQPGQPLKQVGASTQSHASSKGGRTIIWERSGATTEILAIGKHTTRADSKLSKGASYEIEQTFAPSYAGYTGKIIGFKA